MKGYRFYAEMPQERESKSASKAHPFFPWTVAALREKADQGFRCDLVAVPIDDNGRLLWQGNSLCFDIVSVAIEGNRLIYCIGGTSREYLAKRCTRIPEDLARKLSPELFHYLESNA